MANSTKIVELCREHGEVCVDDNQNTCTKSKSCKIIRQYLSIVKDKTTFYSRTDSKGRIALHSACLCSNPEVLKTLLELAKVCGIPSNINTKDNDGQTPLHVAVTNQRAKVVEYLLNHAQNEGIIVHSRDQLGKTPFHYARVTKNQELVDLFVWHFIERMIPAFLKKTLRVRPFLNFRFLE